MNQARVKQAVQEQEHDGDINMDRRCPMCGGMMKAEGERKRFLALFICKTCGFKRVLEGDR